MTAFEKLLEQLPPDRRVEAALALESLGHESPIFSLYVEVLAGIEAKSSEREERLVKMLAEADEREKQRLAKIAISQAETQKIMQSEVRNLSGDQPWQRGRIKTAFNGLVWCLSVVVGIMILRHNLQDEFGSMREVVEDHKKVVEDHRKIIQTLSDDPASLAAFAQYTKEANSEALDTALSLHAISKLMTMPKMQMYRSSDGFLTIAGSKSLLPIGTTEDGRNWVKLANPAAFVSPDSTPAIDKALEAEKELKRIDPK